MAKKMALKDLAAQVEAQAQAMAELQAKLDAVTAQATEAQAKAQAEAEKAKAAEAILAEVAGSSNNVMAFDRDIRPVFDFRNYAIPGGDFAVEKVNSRNDNITSSVNVPLDSLFSFEVAQREVDPEEYVRTKPGIYVFNDGEAKIRTYYKPAKVAKLEYPLTAPVRQFPEAGLKYEDTDIPKTEGYLKMKALTDKEIGELVWQMFKAQHYQKPQYAFQRASAKYDANKLPNVGAPKTKTAGAGAGAGGGRKTTTPKGAKAAYITAFDQYAWGDFTLLGTDGLADRRKVQRDGVTVAAVIVKGNGYEITATEAKFQAAGISLDGAKKHGSRYVVTLDTPEQVMEFCQAQ